MKRSCSRRKSIYIYPLDGCEKLKERCSLSDRGGDRRELLGKLHRLVVVSREVRQLTPS